MNVCPSRAARCENGQLYQGLSIAVVMRLPFRVQSWQTAVSIQTFYATLQTDTLRQIQRVPLDPQCWGATPLPTPPPVGLRCQSIWTPCVGNLSQIALNQGR